MSPMPNENEENKEALDFCEKVLRRKDLCPEARKEWEKERKRIIRDCYYCGGEGVVGTTEEDDDGRVLEDEIPCPVCRK